MLVIIAVLSAVGLNVVSKSMKKAAQIKSMSNMRQIGQLVVGYGADHGGRLMPIKDWRKDGSGAEYHIHWHQAIIEDTITDGDSSKLVWNRDWWQDYQPIVLNPLFKDDPTWQIWNPGYAMNNLIHQKIEAKYQTNKNEVWEKQYWGSSPPLAAIPDPSRTPLIVQNINYHMGGLLAGTRLGSDKRLDNFLVEGKMNVTFVDGHSELLRFTDDKGSRLPTCEYVERGFDKMPEL